MRTLKVKSGWYIFADGFKAWSAPMSWAERRVLIAEHGEIIQFIPAGA